MAQDYIPVKIVGPGSQPEDPDGLAADFDNMPDEMHTYSAPILPEPEDTKGLDQALQHAALLQQALDQCDINSANNPAIELDQLDRQNREFFDQILGEGEVGIQANGSVNAHCQESLLAGVWRVQYHRPDGVVYKDTVEVGAIPNLVKHHGFNGAQANIAPNKLSLPRGLYNAAPLLTEIHDTLAKRQANHKPHVINLSLLPHSEQDLVYLSQVLGQGSLQILSRGYGNCRISSTGTKHVWWVQYFNSQDTLILNSLEISQVPDVACAAIDDLTDSRQRLQEILAVYQ